MRELGKPLQRSQIRQLGNIILRQNKRREIRHALVQPRLDTAHSIPCQQESLQPRTQGEVRDGGDIIVGEVDAFVVFGDDAEVLDGGDSVAFGRISNVSTSSLSKYSMLSFSGHRLWGVSYLVGRARAL